MKKTFSYYKIKWTAFTITILVLGFGLAAIYLMRRPQNTTQEQSPANENAQEAETAGFYTNEAFSSLIEENLKELGFSSNLSFVGREEGQFTLSGTLADPSRLSAICTDLKPFESLLSALKGETVTINGHLGEQENGNGQWVADTITFSGYSMSAAAATPYIEEYTGLNDLIAVPYDDIAIDQNGITFHNAIPASIQTAAYSSPASVPEE